MVRLEERACGFLKASERSADPRTKLLQARLGRRRALRFAGPWAENCPPSESFTSSRKCSSMKRIAHCGLTPPSHEDLRIRQINAKDRLCLTPLDKLEEPPRLLKLKDQVDSLLPRVDLPDAILEIHALTGLADAFAHISEGGGRVG